MSLDEELRGAFLTAGLTDQQHAELLDVAEEVHLDEGAIAFVEGESADHLWMLLEGRVELSRRSGNDIVVMMTMTNAGQWAGGLTAWSGDDAHAGYRATGRVVAPSRFLRLRSEDLGRLVEAWFPFGKHLTVGIYQTIRGIEAMVRQRESLVALGTLAAGLAHEINNPAAASIRAVSAMRGTTDGMVDALTRLAEASIEARQFTELAALRAEVAANETSAAGALAVADAEEEIGVWLDGQGVPRAWELAPTLAAHGVDQAWCERVRDAIGTDGLGAGISWVAASLQTTDLLDELGDTTGRISALISAVRSYSQVDRAAMQRVDIHEGIDSTLVMLRHKSGTIELERDFDPSLPEIEVNAGELNQVWTNLIDNAVDAMDGQGTLRITTRRVDDDLVVEIADTGSGMAPDVQARAFEPFFTTKDVGRGTGLGLDISRRIVVEHHGGDITFDSSSAGTTARVRLPLTRS